MHLRREQLQTSRCQCCHRRGCHYLEKRWHNQWVTCIRCTLNRKSGNHTECSAPHGHVPFKSTYLPHFLSRYDTCWLFLDFCWLSVSKRLPKPPLLPTAAPRKPPLLLESPCNSTCINVPISKIIMPSCQSTSKSECSSRTIHPV